MLASHHQSTSTPSPCCATRPLALGCHAAAARDRASDRKSSAPDPSRRPPWRSLPCCSGPELLRLDRRPPSTGEAPTRLTQAPDRVRPARKGSRSSSSALPPRLDDRSSLVSARELLDND